MQYTKESRWIVVTSDRSLDVSLEEAYEERPSVPRASYVEFRTNLPDDPVWCFRFIVKNCIDRDFKFTHKGLTFVRKFNGGTRYSLILTVNDPDGSLFPAFSAFLRIFDIRQYASDASGISSKKKLEYGGVTKISYEGPVRVTMPWEQVKPGMQVQVQVRDGFSVESMVRDNPHIDFDVYDAEDEGDAQQEETGLPMAKIMRYL
jgi:hypothetical protein